MLKPAGIWKSCHDWRSLKQLLSCSSKTGVSLYLAYLLLVAHTIDIHQAIFCFCQPPSCLLYISSASIPFFACELKAVTPYRRGFFCGDSTITYPYVEREAIPDSLLIAGGIAITGLTVRQCSMMKLTSYFCLDALWLNIFLSFFCLFFRLHWVNVTGSGSVACTHGPLFETSMCHACTKS